MRSAIVLAGGRSSRFAGDKLTAEFEGATLLGTTLAGLAGVVDRVVVAGPKLPADWRGASFSLVALVRDAEPFAGPLAALANVLARAEPDVDDLAIVVGGDMPLLVPGVLKAMLDRLEADPGVTGVILERDRATSQADAARHVLPLAVRVTVARRAAREAIEEGHRSLGALLDRLAVAEVPVSAWRALDPDAETLLDVDTVADLDRMARRHLH